VYKILIYNTQETKGPKWKMWEGNNNLVEWTTKFCGGKVTWVLNMNSLAMRVLYTPHASGYTITQKRW